ncbi:hypothetical protein D3C83_180340 [compost metagenome]
MRIARIAETTKMPLKKIENPSISIDPPSPLIWLTPLALKSLWCCHRATATKSSPAIAVTALRKRRCLARMR